MNDTPFEIYLIELLPQSNITQSEGNDLLGTNQSNDTSSNLLRAKLFYGTKKIYSYGNAMVLF